MVAIGDTPVRGTVVGELHTSLGKARVLVDRSADYLDVLLVEASTFIG